MLLILFKVTVYVVSNISVNKKNHIVCCYRTHTIIR